MIHGSKPIPPNPQATWSSPRNLLTSKRNQWLDAIDFADLLGMSCIPLVLMSISQSAVNKAFFQLYVYIYIFIYLYINNTVLHMYIFVSLQTLIKQPTNQTFWIMFPSQTLFSSGHFYPATSFDSFSASSSDWMLHLVKDFQEFQHNRRVHWTPAASPAQHRPSFPDDG